MYILKTKFGNIGVETNQRGISKIILGIYLKKISANKIIQNAYIKKIIPDLKRYFLGESVEFDINYDISTLPIFTQKVLKETRKIPYGKTINYSELASRVGKPNASRAVGQALANNPIPIIIPCHRVVKKDGSLGGFSAGLRWKKLLLRLENSYREMS